jgi:hypothetical protein
MRRRESARRPIDRGRRCGSAAFSRAIDQRPWPRGSTPSSARLSLLRRGRPHAGSRLCAADPAIHRLCLHRVPPPRQPKATRPGLPDTCARAACLSPDDLNCVRRKRRRDAWH